MKEFNIHFSVAAPLQFLISANNVMLYVQSLMTPWNLHGFDARGAIAHCGFSATCALTNALIARLKINYVKFLT